MKTRVAAIFSVLVLIMLVLPTRAQDRRDVWVLNNTGHQIDSVYLSRHGTRDPWSNDVLGQDVLPYGEGSKIVFSGGASTCMYDFRLVYTDGSSQEYMQGRNLCTAIAILFNNNVNFVLE